MYIFSFRLSMKRVSGLFDKYMRESLFAKVGFAVEFRAKTKLGLGVLRRGEEVCLPQTQI